jgi:hypothetical protein
VAARLVLPACNGSGDDKLVSTFERDVTVARPLDGLAVPFDERVAPGEAEALEQLGDRLAALELVCATVDGDHDFEITPASGLDGTAVGCSSMIPA